jgi:hypothetical protein
MRISLLLLLVMSVSIVSCASGGAKSDANPSAAPKIIASTSPSDPPKDDVLDAEAAAAPAIPTASDQDAASTGETPTSGGFRTKYTVIQEGYDRASSMPDISDFDLLDDGNPHTACFSTKSSDPMTMTEMVIKQMMVQIEGAPDFGPLFPGTTDHGEPRLVIGKNNGWVNSVNLTNDRRKVFELSKNSDALIIKIVENKFGIYQDIGNPAEVWLKKNAKGLIFFKVFKLDSTRKRNEVFIGYCYRKM